MAAVYAGSAVVCTGTTTIQGPIDIDGVQNSATTSYTITRGGTTMLSGAAGTGATSVVRIRSAGPIVVTVVGGGSVTLFLKVAAER